MKSVYLGAQPSQLVNSHMNDFSQYYYYLVISVSHIYCVVGKYL